MLRRDQKVIADLVEENSKVLDIGCGAGDLLWHLTREKKIRGRGIELSSEKTAEALKNGISAIQGDADSDLQYYTDKSFDYVILGQTLQATKEPKKVLLEALRIGKRAIVVIPNFGNIRNRFYLLLNGRMPVTKELSYEWYETPNIHFCTIRDFVNLCKEVDAKIEESFYLNGADEVRKFFGNGTFGANLFGNYGIFVLSRN